MENMLLRDIIAAIGCGGISDDIVIQKISTDSRDIGDGCLFIALAGDKFDGHNYVIEALNKGAVRAVVMRDGTWPEDKILRVKDTRQAFLDIAGLYRKQMDVKIVGVTGSVGKTTTKEMIACAVAAEYRTHKTFENLNNEIGVPQTILGITNEHQAAVLEMGMDAPGQIAYLSKSAVPDIAVVTTIGTAHIENFPETGRQGILREKLDITAGMKDGATLIINLDNDLLQTVDIPRLNLMTYGIINSEVMIRAEAVRCFSTHTTFEIRYNGKRYDAQIPTMGVHNVYNALAAFCVVTALGLEPHRAIAALRDYKPAGMRQKIVTHCGFTVVEDCYNSSPDSMAAALTTLGELDTNGRRIMVMSDMLELGEIGPDEHYKAGEIAAASGIDMLFCTGELSRRAHAGATDCGMKQSRYYETKEELFASLKEVLWEEDICWFKASRGMKIEEILEMIYKSNF